MPLGFFRRLCGLLHALLDVLLSSVTTFEIVE
jgi:hypothetical protein